MVWERTAGQAVQVGLAAVLLLALPSPVRAYLPAVVGLAAAVGLAAFGLAWLVRRRGPSRLVRALRSARDDIRAGLLGRRAWLGIVAASAVAMLGHLATFLVAARTAGVSTSITKFVFVRWLGSGPPPGSSNRYA